MAQSSAVVQLAQQQIGTPYAWGGESPSGFDCSGLLQYVYGKQGVQIPRTTYDQYRTGQPVDASQLQPGDAVFFTGSDPKDGLPGHVAIYIGNGKVIAAPHSGSTVQVQDFATIAKQDHFVGARRYSPTGATAAVAASSAVGAKAVPQKAAPEWPPSATLAYHLGTQAGLNPQQAKDFAAVQYGESGFNPNAKNPQSGAAGLYQLLSPGYVQKANQLGGVLNPRANIQSILPDYVSYYQSHPFQPGAAGAAVERSGKGPDYYAQGWQHLPGMPGAAAALGAPTAPGGLPGAAPGLQKPPAVAAPIRLALQLLGAGGPR